MEKPIPPKPRRLREDGHLLCQECGHRLQYCYRIKRIKFCPKCGYKTPE